MPSAARESVLIVEGDPAAAAVARCLRAAGVPVRYAHGVAPRVHAAARGVGGRGAGALRGRRVGRDPCRRARPSRRPVVVYLPRGSDRVGAERAAVRAAAFAVLDGARYDPAVVEAAARLVQRGELDATKAPDLSDDEADGGAWRRATG